jgi:transcriptional regulator with XRE-family HTH domain
VPAGSSAGAGAVRRNVEKQREYYGEPLGDRVRRLVVAFDVSQAQLADVLGISAPMLSQVMSGRRQRIANPVVLARLVLLERKILVPEVAAGSREAMAAALADVRSSTPAGAVASASSPDRTTLAQGLGEQYPAEELARAAELLREECPALGRLLAAAATEPGR